MRILIVAAMLFLTTTNCLAQESIMSDPNTKVRLTTTLGEITIRLNAEKAPISSENFLTYVKEGFYNGTIFHRIIPGFMAQGGGFDTDFNQKAVHPPIKNEADNGLANSRGTLAMARTPDPHSAPNGWGYAVFGEVIEGMDVVDAMGKEPTGNRGMHQDVPKTDIVIEKAEIIE